MSSRRRSIVTPRPTTVALIQASFNASRPPSSRRLKSKNKNQFTSQLIEHIDEQLSRLKDASEIHQIYRDAFSTIIEKYSNYSDSMNAIKKGYDGLIDEFSNEIEENEQKTEMIMESQTSFMNLFESQKQEMENRKQKYANLAIQTEEQIKRMHFYIS